MDSCNTSINTPFRLNHCIDNHDVVLIPISLFRNVLRPFFPASLHLFFCLDVYDGVVDVVGDKSIADYLIPHFSTFPAVQEQFSV